MHGVALMNWENWCRRWCDMFVVRLPPDKPPKKETLLHRQLKTLLADVERREISISIWCDFAQIASQSLQYMHWTVTDTIHRHRCPSQCSFKIKSRNDRNPKRNVPIYLFLSATATQLENAIIVPFFRLSMPVVCTSMHRSDGARRNTIILLAGTLRSNHSVHNSPVESRNHFD